MTRLPLCSLVVLSILFVAQKGQCTSKFSLPELRYPEDALEPHIDKRTMELHRGVHHRGYVNNLNQVVQTAGLQRYSTLSSLIADVGTKQFAWDVERQIRNQGGGHWNHAFFWKIMAPANSEDVDKSKSVSHSLRVAMEAAFGSVDEGIKQVTTQAGTVFGSGWSWLVVKADGGLQVVTSTNQDNPIMKGVCAVQGIPILGVDVWEHAYYLKHGPSRAKYLEDWTKVIHWKQVSENYDLAKAGKIEDIAAPV